MNLDLRLARFPTMIASVGLGASSGITTALIVGVSVLPTIILQWRGVFWHKGA